MKKGALKIFAKFTGKHLCQGLFLNKVAGRRPKISNSIQFFIIISNIFGYKIEYCIFFC